MYASSDNLIGSLNFNEFYGLDFDVDRLNTFFKDKSPLTTSAIYLTGEMNIDSLSNTFSNLDSASTGGALFLSNGISFTDKESTLKQNTALKGGAIYCS